MSETILIAGSCLEHLKDVGDNTIDAIVTDPPYGLSKEPKIEEVLRHWLAGTVYEHKGGGFMGKTWDSFVPGPEYWREFLRVLKPGGHALVFGGTRTVDLLTIAIRMGGFEIRDQLAWLYGSGFPKSLDVSKAIDKALGAKREVVGKRKAPGMAKSNVEQGAQGRSKLVFDETSSEAITPEAERYQGYGTALKPAQEPIILARKPLEGTVAANVLKWGTGALNIDGCRIETDDGEDRSRPPRTPNEILGGGRGTNLTASPHNPEGRWPANVLLDPDAADTLDEQSGDRPVSGSAKTGRRSAAERSSDVSTGIMQGTRGQGRLHNESGGASRFFYVAKPSRRERDAGVSAPPSTGGEATGRKEGSDGLNSPRAGAGRGGGARNRHPTVKPIALMRYLIRLVTPPGAIVMDPFMGSGTTGCAAVLEGVHFLGFDLDPEYVQLAEERIAHWRAQGEGL